MNIWYVHPYLGVPDNAEYGRGYLLGSALAKLDVQLRVITSSFHHLIQSDYDQQELVFSKKISDVHFSWIKTPKYKNNGLKRIINMFTFGWRFRWVDLVKDHSHEKPDVIIITSTHPFHIFGGIYYSKKYNAKLICEIRDLWPLSLNEILGVSTFHPFSILLAWIEKKMYVNANKIVSLLPNTKDYMIQKGMDKEKFHYIPNGTSLIESKKQLSKYKDFLFKLKKQHAFILMYTGAIGIPNDMEPIVDAAAILQNKGLSNISFVIIGEGGTKQVLKDKVEDESINNIHFLDAIPRNEIQDTLSYSDLLFIGGKNLDLYKFGVSPNKMFEYMLAAKPIMMTISSPNNPLEQSNAGICLGNNDPNTIADEIIKYSKLSHKKLEEIGRRGEAYVKKHHLYDVLAQQYLDIINNAS